MKLVTWNVNGLKSAVRNGFEDWLAREDPDVICLQETKLQNDMFTEMMFSGYRMHLFPSKRPGYSGVATLIKDGISLNKISRGGLGAKFDNEGRILTAVTSDYTIVNLYAPHSHRELINLPKKLEFGERLIKFLERIYNPGRPTIVVGDFNVALENRDLENDRQNQNNAGFRIEERDWFRRVLDLGFVDAFRIFEEEGGHYTWWSPITGVRERNVGWRLDYILVDSSLVRRVGRCFHSPEVLGSDHCPVSVVL